MTYIDGESPLAVRLISQYQYIDALLGIVLRLRHPKLVNVLKARLIRYVIHNDDAIGSLIVTRRNGSESVLASRIPYLELYALSINFDSLKPTLVGGNLKSTPMVVR